MATFNERMAREFMSMGHQVTIYTFSLQYPSFLFPGTTQYSTAEAPKGLDIRVRVNSVNPFNWESVGRELRELAPDLIVVRFWLPLMGPALGRILRIAGRNGKTRSVCIADNIIPHEKRPGDRWFTRYFLKAPDAFVTMSGKVTDDLHAFGTSRPVRQLRHPLYDHFGDPLPKGEARERIGLPASGRLILFFGFIRHYKGLDILLDAMADPRIREAGIKLLVAGEFYQDAKPYHQQISKLSLGDSVILRNSFIPDDEVRYYCSAADLIVQPYRSATQSGVTPLAYHFEKPMLVTRVGGLPDMVPEGKAGLVTAPEPGSIAEGILTFYRMGEDHFIPGLRDEKKKYSWRTFCDEIFSAAHDH